MNLESNLKAAESKEVQFIYYYLRFVNVTKIEFAFKAAKLEASALKAATAVAKLEASALKAAKLEAAAESRKVIFLKTKFKSKL